MSDATPTASAGLSADLGAIVGAGAVLDPGAHPEYGHDATAYRGLSGRPDVIVLPGSASEVADVLRYCYERGFAVVPRGGGTGLAGGAVPVEGGVVVASDRLRAIRSFAPERWTIEVEAGVRTADVQRLARENGLLFAPDPGAAEQSHIGGNVATNAGGPHAFKYGVTGRAVSGLEAAMAPGELARFGGPLPKDVAGYDLVHLLVGSEGTLGLVTAATLRLLPAPEASEPLVAFFAAPEAGCAAVAELVGSGTAGGGARVPRRRHPRRGRRRLPGHRPGRGRVRAGDRGRRLSGRGATARGRGRGGPRSPPRSPSTLRRGGRSARRSGAGATASPARSPGSAAARSPRTSRCRSTGSGRSSRRPLEIGERHGLPACSWGHAGDGNVHSSFLIDPRRRGAAGARRGGCRGSLRAGDRARRHGLRRARHRLAEARPARAPVGPGGARRAARGEAGAGPEGAAQPGQEGRAARSVRERARKLRRRWRARRNWRRSGSGCSG